MHSPANPRFSRTAEGVQELQEFRSCRIRIPEFSNVNGDTDLGYESAYLTISSHRGRNVKTVDRRKRDKGAYLAHSTRFYTRPAMSKRQRVEWLSARRLQSSDHRDNLVLVGLLRSSNADLLAALQYTDVIRKAEYLVETVANDEDRQIARF
jgi:hypothetical protein